MQAQGRATGECNGWSCDCKATQAELNDGLEGSGLAIVNLKVYHKIKYSEQLVIDYLSPLGRQAWVF